MPGIVRVGDTDTGHGKYGPTAATEGSPDTNVNGKAVHRVGDALAAHEHSRVSGCGSPDVFVNSKAVVRIGDCVACGGVFVTGSSDTIIN